MDFYYLPNFVFVIFEFIEVFLAQIFTSMPSFPSIRTATWRRSYIFDKKLTLISSLYAVSVIPNSLLRQKENIILINCFHLTAFIFSFSVDDFDQRSFLKGFIILILYRLSLNIQLFATLKIC
jgi:hypothetical protein